jgi:hypothetical protein
MVSLSCAVSAPPSSPRVMAACMDSDEEGMVRSAAQGAHAEFIISDDQAASARPGGQNWIAARICFHFAFIDGFDFSFPSSPVYS